MRKLILSSSAIFYKHILKNIFFLFDPEFVHEKILSTGKFIGDVELFNYITSKIFLVKKDNLKQQIRGIKFDSPVGLAAGFDYQAKLYNILPSFSFGFETIGTITNLAYVGNTKPRLGRLPKSKSLLVNKGFKNEGIKEVVKKLSNRRFDIPVGLSIGKTNTKKITTQEMAVSDIISAFKVSENSKINISYYELNISCPNLIGNIDFYESSKLENLLKKVFLLNIKKPIFIKMPISKTNGEIMKMMEIIVKYPIGGVIVGNLQKDRNSKALVKEELVGFNNGNFSGKPTEERSNELIELIYRKYGKKIIIIGCGGIFSAEDAYKKIKLGASLVQLITGLVFEGPQLVSNINYELNKMIKKEGFKNISQAVGSSI